MSFEVNLLVKTTAILACVGLLAAMMRRTSASARYAVWAFGLLAVLAFPLVSGVLPTIDLPVLPVAETTHQVLESSATEPVSTAPAFIIEEQPLAPTTATPPAVRWTWGNWLALAWAVGSLIVFGGWIVALISLHALSRRSRHLTDPEWLDTLASLKREIGVSDHVQLRLAERSTPPMTWGIFRHVILLPSNALEWPAIRCRLVLAHELAHIKRVDGLGQFLAQCVCSVYWFNPLVWYAIRRLQIERERACDDTVLRLGASATDYADHLLQIARGLRSRFVLAAVCMAQPSQLKSRMIAILDPHTRRQTLSRAASAALLMLVATLTLSTATLHVTAMAPLVLPKIAGPAGPTGPPGSIFPFLKEAAPTPALQASPATGSSSIEGRIMDATTGEPIAEVDVSLPQPNAAPRVAATTDGEGRFKIEGLPAGSYQLTTTKEGYARLRPDSRNVPGNAGVWLTLETGQSLKDLTLRLRKSAVVTGRVFDTQGRPVSGGEVSLVRVAYDRYGERILSTLAGAGTNDRGEFRAFGVEAGEYYVRVAADNEPYMPPPGGETFAEAFYPGVTDITRATLIKVDWGAELRLGDTTVQPVKAVPVRLKIVNESGAPESGIRSFTLYRNGQLINGITSSPNLSGGTGRFELYGLAPGTYDIAVGWGGNDKMSGARRTVEVTGTEVTGDLVVRKAPMVSGRFLIQEADGALKPIAASMRLEKVGFQLSGAGDAEGNFTIPAVPEEVYWTRFARLPAGAYALSMKQDGAAVRADQVRISRDTTLEVVFAAGGGSVAGTVRNEKGEKVANAVVAALPGGALREHGHLYRSGTSDQNGNFVMTNVAPGAYEVFAWSDLEGDAFRNAEFMKRFEDRGSAVEVKGNAAANVEVRVADEVKR